MKPVKEYYRTYQADESMLPLNEFLCREIVAMKPAHVLEFGCGTGKNLLMIQSEAPEIDTFGIDISFLNCIKAFGKDLNNITHGDEGMLGHLGNFDVVFTCSVLDHIEDIESIIEELKRIANKSIVIAETNTFDGNYYWKHNYEAYGFELHKYVGGFPSPDDGGMYFIWKWNKPEPTNTEDHHE